MRRERVHKAKGVRKEKEREILKRVKSERASERERERDQYGKNKE